MLTPSLADDWKRVRVPYVLAAIVVLPTLIVLWVGVVTLAQDNGWAAMIWGLFSAPTIPCIIALGLVNLWMYRRHGSRKSLRAAAVAGASVAVWLVELALILNAPLSNGC